jgi:hypothetical protein
MICHWQEYPSRLWAVGRGAPGPLVRAQIAWLCAALTWAEAWPRDSRVNGGSSGR